MLVTWTILPVASSHTFMDLSTDPVTRYWLLSEHVRQVILSVWLTSLMIDPLVKLQICNLLNENESMIPYNLIV